MRTLRHLFNPQRSKLQTSTIFIFPQKTVTRTLQIQKFGTNSDSSTKIKNKKKPSSLEDHHFCVDLVRKRDRDGYLCGLLQPSGASKDAYFAIRAFNVEIASIKDGQKSRTAGSIKASQMKMQWWREAVADMYINVPKTGNIIQNPAALHQPVVRSLDRAVKDWGLTRRFLDKMVDARERDLEIDQYDSLNELIRYGTDTWTCLFYLNLESVGVRESSADEVAYHIGIAQTIVTALRSIPYQAARGELAIPSELMIKHAIPSTYLFRPDNDSHKPALCEAVREMAKLARSHLNRARELQINVPKSGRTSLLPAVGAELYLKKLETVANFDVLHQELYIERGGIGDQSVIWHPLLLGRAWLTGVF